MGDLTHASADVPLAIVQGALAQLVSLPTIARIEAELSREEHERLTATLREQQAEAAKIAAAVAANLPVRRSGSEGGKELGYGE